MMKEPVKEPETPTGDPKPPDVHMEVKAERVEKQQNVGTIHEQYIYFTQEKSSKQVTVLPELLPTLPPGLHPFRDPEHERLFKDLQESRILLLTSYQESAGYAAAYTLANDPRFADQKKKALSPSRERDRERSDLDLGTLADDAILNEPQILLVEIGGKCTLLDSVLYLEWGIVGKVRDRLLNRESYLIFSVDEELVDERAALKAKRSFPHYAVSHLRYLLTQRFADQAAEFEKRILAAITSETQLGELYQSIAIRLSSDGTGFEEFVRELEENLALPPAARRERLQPIRAEEVFREESEVHRAVLFVATYLPDLDQRDFDRFVALLLGEQTTTVERTRQELSRDGTIVTIHEEKQERWVDRWLRAPDGIFRDCHMRIAEAVGGSWIVDFNEPYLRRELRTHFERHYPWYLRRQCQLLQRSGIIFALDLSPAAVEGLVRLFVERAVVDPTGFGSGWLLDMVRSLRAQMSSEPPQDSPDDALVWVVEKLLVEGSLRAHFHARLGLLIREMLDRETLRPTVREFFESLIQVRQHDALLNVILDLARRLRFVQHFDPLYWMRRLVDQGSDAARKRTAERLVAMARDSGPRIYEFLADIRKWLPEPERPPARFSASNRLALEFPFEYCEEMAAGVADHLGEWPSRHPLFYALPDDPAETRAAIAQLVEWLLDPRGALSDAHSAPEMLQSLQAAHIGHVADLVEHWAWVLEGESAHGPEEGRALFSLICEEIDGRLSARERSWLQRGWQAQQEWLAGQARIAVTPLRSVLVARKTKLDQLRIRFVKLRTPSEIGH